MKQLWGTVQQGGEVLAEHVEVWLQESVDPRSGIMDWDGSFAVPAGVFLEPGNLYRLMLEDGRSGDVIVSEIQISSGIRGQAIPIRFVGTGPLRRE